METRFTYAIKYVGDMDKAVRFHRDTLGLALKFETPGWTEFATGDVTLALHAATPENPAGTVELGFGVPDVAKFYDEAITKGIKTEGPIRDVHGSKIGSFLDSDGAACSVSSR
jgi:lactoylglutathione lyase